MGLASQQNPRESEQSLKQPAATELDATGETSKKRVRLAEVIGCVGGGWVGFFIALEVCNPFHGFLVWLYPDLSPKARVFEPVPHAISLLLALLAMLIFVAGGLLTVRLISRAARAVGVKGRAKTSHL